MHKFRPHVTNSQPT